MDTEPWLTARIFIQSAKVLEIMGWVYDIRADISMSFCTNVPIWFRLSPEINSKNGHFSTFLAMYLIPYNFGTLVQIKVKYMKSNDFLCTETCTSLYRNSQICTDLGCFVENCYQQVPCG